jgi:Zn-dependent protease
MPMVFVLMGGIGLIGGRTIVDRSAIRDRAWQSGVSLAGPLTNFVLALLIAGVFALGLVDPWSPFGAGLAFLAVLQVSAFLFNLIPVPPLDGFGALAPYLPPSFAARCCAIGQAGFLLLVFTFWTSPAVSDAFWYRVYAVADHLNLPWYAVAQGMAGARFW